MTAPGPISFAPALRRAAGLLAVLCLLLGLLAPPVGGQPSPTPTPAPAAASARAVPAGRAARNVAVITIHGEIDRWTAFGVKRRIARAAADGADALVFDIDTPGGELLACLDICNAIKSSPIGNTVAWIHPTAYSAGSIIALACHEIVVDDPSTFGDALPITGDPLFGIHALPESEREKMLGPLLAEVVDSARRSGYDEMLVQGLVRRGVELWLVEHTKTGERLFVTEDQYRTAVGSEPVRGTPGVPSATGPLASPAPMGPFLPGAETTGTRPASESPTSYTPASTMTSTALAREVDAQLDLKGVRSQRPDLHAPQHAGQYRPVEYVSDGHGLILLKSESMIRYRVAADTVKSDAELKSFFGATSLARLDESWSEALVRFLTFPIVKGLLLVVFLLAAFIEMTHPGVILPGAVALTCLLGLVVPPLLIDLAAWWAVGAVVLGIACIGVEIFLIPGFGFFGIAGILLLFGGMIGIFVGGPGGLFPGTVRARNDLAFGAATVLISTITSLILMYFVGKHLPGMPGLNRLVLKQRHGHESDGGLLAAMAAADGPVALGATGLTLTSLRPAGRVQIGEQIVDVVAEMGFIDAGEPVRVVSTDRFRTVVERVAAVS